MNTLLLTDFYKTTHHNMYPRDLEYITSYFVPRMTRVPMQSVVHFGLQGVIQNYLIDEFNRTFFNRDLEEVCIEYALILEATLGEQPALDATNRVVELHRLGYLPIRIAGIVEGTSVPMGVPTFSITNTHPNFAWVVNALETLLSTSMWHQMVSATVAREYFRTADHYVEKTASEGITPSNILADFSLRGQESMESGIRSSAAFLTHFTKTATIPAILYLNQHYNPSGTLSLSDIGVGSVSTEHSVMCSNFSVDGDERTFVKRLLTELYKNTSFSMVSDSYDYWNMVHEILPSLRKEIEAHNGVLLVRGDSGNPIEIVTETVYALWEHFGGHVNEKGYKVLNPKVRAIYGDSITLQRAEAIFNTLEKAGFSVENVVLGVGSFSMQAMEYKDELLPFTRDTFGIAIKATHGVLKGGEEIFILKDPKTDSGNFKKSHRGLIFVQEASEEEDYKAIDGLGVAQFKEIEKDGALQTVFENGYMVRTLSIADIRNIAHTRSKIVY